MMIKFVLWTMVCKWAITVSDAVIHGKYTKSLNKDYHLAIPHKLTSDGKFSSFHLSHFHDYRIELYKERKKRSMNDPEMLHYGVVLNDALYHLELWPNRDFLHPNLVVEKRDPEIKIRDRYVRTLKDKKLCHYTGRIRGFPRSRAAISTCDGLAGYIALGNKTYYIEPVEGHTANDEGHHLHVIYDQPLDGERRTCGSLDSWKDSMKDRFSEELFKGQDIFKAKRSEVDHTYIEVGVVCDRTFLMYHRRRDVELYVMTIMNMAADYYHDSSVGHQMDLVVVRIIYLEKEEREINLEINRDSAKTLRSFCDWAIRVNTPVDSSNHYDLAVLLTRFDLCAHAEEDCGLTGLAYLGGACSKDSKCAITEDIGLALSVVVAHEIGHLLGARHDQQETPCASQDIDGSFFVMSPVANSYTRRWSSCSRSLINAFLDNNLGRCLSDVPHPTLYPFSENLPGVIYDANEQCRFMLPSSLGVCSSFMEQVCQNLVCKINEGECIGKNEISVDGTKCGENKWCFNRNCIEMGLRPEAINGGWGAWGHWSACTRSCGGGLTFSDRECTNPPPANGGRFCFGEKRRMKICNSQPCPGNLPTFRQQQCTEQNSIPWNGEYHTWTSSFQEEEPCVLYCVNERYVLSKLQAIAKDGTQCKHGTKNICISGVCRVVGCDDVIGSDAVEDRCGVCNGDGTQCKTIQDIYRDIGRGYTKVVMVPSGARKIVFEEKAPSENIMAISDSSEKKFYLNGNDTENLDGEYQIGQAIGIYMHSEPNKEIFILNGPLKEDIVFFVDFFDQKNPGFAYRWTELTVDFTYEPQYHWEIGEFGDCSAICGGGVQTAIINCIEENAGKVSTNFCGGIDKPEGLTKNCNEQECKKKWQVGPWGRCRGCKNRGGFRTRVVQCVQENSKKGGDKSLLEDTECEDAKPGFLELCETEEKCRRKRWESAYIPGKHQKNIWRQMKRNFTYKILKVRHMNPDEEFSEQHSEQNQIKAYANKLIYDFRPLEEEILIRYSIKPNPLQVHLSDKADSQLGGLIGDVIDTQHKMVIKGKEAVTMKQKLEHSGNFTLQALTCLDCHAKNRSDVMDQSYGKPKEKDEEKEGDNGKGENVKDRDGK
ncbi:A disintegrin and metalloproteinase with thrombospondin motifs 12-like [Euwallacea similis]|uniref:A disintegrin and metalloproteinase with thrombospondin motifs 12-like n=1 Tax=Euwallacea similis TaxID=1736056 RepID=UPI00344FE052